MAYSKAFVFAAMAHLACVTTSEFNTFKDSVDKRFEQGAPPGTSGEAPIGSIVMSMLDEKSFRQTQGPTTRWVLCNGANYPNTKWAQVRHQMDPSNSSGQVPDFTDRYPRGWDKQRKHGDFANQASSPLTPWDLGQSALADAFRDHKHRLDGGDPNRWGIMKDACGGCNQPQGNEVARWGYAGQLWTTGSDAGGGEETRPKTTIVNFYIRID